MPPSGSAVVSFFFFGTLSKVLPALKSKDLSDARVMF